MARRSISLSRLRRSRLLGPAVARFSLNLKLDVSGLPSGGAATSKTPMSKKIHVGSGVKMKV